MKQITRSMNSPSLCGEGAGACCAMAGAMTLSTKPSTRTNSKGNLAISSSKIAQTTSENLQSYGSAPLESPSLLRFPPSQLERAKKREK